MKVFWLWRDSNVSHQFLQFEYKVHPSLQSCGWELFGTLWWTACNKERGWERGLAMGYGAFHCQDPILSRSVEMGSHYWLTAVQWPVRNEEVVSVQFPCGQVSLTSKPPPALAVPGSSACTLWTEDGTSTVQWLQRTLHAAHGADSFEWFWYHSFVRSCRHGWCCGWAASGTVEN